MADLVTVDTSGVNAALREFVRHIEGNAAPVVQDEMGLLCLAAMRATPPKRAGQGRATVKRQIMSTMPPMSEDAGPGGGAIRSKWLRGALKAQSISGVNDYIRSSGAFRGQAASFDESWHESQRRKGRVKHAKRHYMVTKSDHSALNKYVTRKQKNVGLYKSAWGYYAERYGKRVPKWVSNRYSKNGFLRGAKIEKLGKREQFPSIALSVGSHPYLLNSIHRAVKVRERSLLRKVNLILRGAADRVNTGGKFRIKTGPFGAFRSGGR